MSDAQALARVRIVLVDTSHPGNVGGAARAMKAMGLRELCLVRPQQFPHAEATARASGADDLLAAARICDSLEEAVAEGGYVVATSARARTLRWPELTPREAAAELIARTRGAPGAVVFGSERSGLDNRELERCQAAVRVPTAADFSSLNLAAAVQILAYEIRLAAVGAPAPVPDDDPPARHADLEQCVAELERVLVELAFLDPANPRLLMRRLRRMLARVRPSAAEVNILRGILTAIDRRLGR